MPINILVNGAFGRMGQMTVKTISEHSNFNLVGQTGRDYDLKKSIRDSQAQVVIDFTTAETVFQNCLTIIETGAHPVIGTSGLATDQVDTLRKQCAELKLGGVIAPNFSIGGVLMMKHAKQIAKYMSHVEIIEMHHNNKIDSPSATALRSVEMLAETQQPFNQPVKPLHEIIPGSRGASYCNIPIHAIRLPGLLAHQQIIFGNTGETLTLRHDSIDRQCFMPGVCLACEKVMKLDHLVFGLEEIL
ncbi:MAG TPA: 4-hydroxy-tetrahydrodipicolinate reductase [Gammaproteobacteria bacterium]|nr:4-hydroxy-tetrahydrodipicolinate reductase [Gammaproteobacteria bacterium]